MDAYKKRRLLNWTIVGTVSGLIISSACYFLVANNASYFIFTVFGALIGAAQGYLSDK